jgi:hypothetical protein
MQHQALAMFMKSLCESVIPLRQRVITHSTEAGPYAFVDPDDSFSMLTRTSETKPTPVFDRGLVMDSTGVSLGDHGYMTCLCACRHAIQGTSSSRSHQ